ncbi:hypothetical protein Cni_G14999 [Canna indica]|uniref:DUF4005 domain-containing protein n=1 Tax=Canna indica TaxID=4628 RepID=A0AAQ3KD22_9LILI|nr:hypothetical protein Cni_G14999 [Canna indica]
MGRAARWLRALFGGKKVDLDECSKEKRKWGFVMPFREKGQQQRRGDHAAAAAEGRKGSRREAQRGPFPAEEEDEEEHNKRAIAVAAATAAVAEAAVAAAQAAAAVVRLTSSGRAAAGFVPAAVSKREEAATKIQAAFRAYLARRALKALKGLVKLQALVRGNIVRKQAAETLRCMQALVRVQARARACRVLRSERCRFQKTPSTHTRIPSRSDAGSRDRASSGGWNWLDRWMEERYWDSRESMKKSGSAPMDDEKSAKILEVDPGKPQLHHKRRNAHNHSSCSTLTSDQNSHSFVTVPDSPSTESTAAKQLHSSAAEAQQAPGHPRLPFEAAAAAAAAAEYSESPQFYSAASSRPGSSRRGPFTPAKSECSRSLFSGYSDYPNYMANTESSRAKVRSHSAPKQRPADRQQNPAAALAQRSSSLHAKFSNKAYPGSGRLDRLGMPIRI